jgi:hypothetical protein
MVNLTLDIKAVIKSEIDFREVSSTKLYVDSFHDDVMQKKSCGSVDWHKGKTVEIFENFESGMDDLDKEYFLTFEFDGKKYSVGFYSEEEQKLAFQKILKFSDKFCGISVELHKGCGALAAIKHKVKEIYDDEDYETEGFVAFVDKDGLIWNEERFFFGKEIIEKIRDIFLLSYLHPDSKTGRFYYKPIN